MSNYNNELVRCTRIKQQLIQKFETAMYGAVLGASMMGVNIPDGQIKRDCLKKFYLDKANAFKTELNKLLICVDGRILYDYDTYTSVDAIKAIIKRHMGILSEIHDETMSFDKSLLEIELRRYEASLNFLVRRIQANNT